MDFKLIRNTICICSLSILVILGFVFYTNHQTKETQSASRISEDVQGSDMVQGTDASHGVETSQGANTSGNEHSSGGNIALNGDTRAFLYDETFGDPEEEADVLVDENQAMRVSLIATSVQQDLRLQIVDSNGELVSGENFYVTVEDVGQFKDLDKDGIIYVGDLRAGDYTVFIDEMEGYHVAASRMKVRVKDKVEYRTIDDISLLIMSEDEIDVDLDAISGHDVAVDSDDTEVTSALKNMDTAVMGIDVSSFNGEIDWKKVKADGIEFAIIRCGYRGYTTGSLVEDKYFLRNIIGANEAGVKVGLYFFTQAVNEVEAVEEASMVITLCREYQVDLPVFIDTESIGGNGRADLLDAKTRTMVCQAFCETMENAGYRAGVYASKNWFNMMLQRDELRKYVTWLAEYKEEATYDGDYQFWQYTSSGWVDGVTGRVDLNIGNLSLANLNKEKATEDDKGGSDTEGSGDTEDDDSGANDDSGADNDSGTDDDKKSDSDSNDNTANSEESGEEDGQEDTDPEGQHSASHSKGM